MSKVRATRVERLEAWASRLTREQLVTLTAQLTDELVNAEIVRFWAESAVPYWEGNGESLVEGQEPFPEEVKGA